MDRVLLENGCQCPSGHPPCEFCTSMTEEECAVYCEGGIDALRALIDREVTTSVCQYTIITLMREGCICGHIRRYL